MKSSLAFSIGAAVLVAGLLSASGGRKAPSADDYKPDAKSTFTCQKESEGETTAKISPLEWSNSTTTKALLDTYYEGLAKKKSGWESVISDDFKFVDGDMTKRTPIIGRDAFIKIINGYSQLFLTMRVKEMMVADDRAYVLASYNYVFPGSKGINGDVVELWKIREGKLDRLTVFYDTLTFERLRKPPPKT